MNSLKSSMLLMKNERGFTLVELLIVIVVIGILSAMMMLSSTEVAVSAKANNIVVAMRQWKTAALAWYADNADRVDSEGSIFEGRLYTDKNSGRSNFAENVKPSEIAKYLNGNYTDDWTVNTGLGAYHIKDKASNMEFWTDHVNGGKTWLIGCQFADNDNDKRLIQKLAGRAASAGLVYKNNSLPQYPSSGQNGNNDNLHRVWIVVADFR
ncbi:MAG: type II secretion system protein [Synergistaceae bacterium]|nr:type II secretion system protein [Synergistaceae bacterium]